MGRLIAEHSSARLRRQWKEDRHVKSLHFSVRLSPINQKHHDIALSSRFLSLRKRSLLALFRVRPSVLSLPKVIKSGHSVIIVHGQPPLPAARQANTAKPSNKRLHLMCSLGLWQQRCNYKSHKSTRWSCR